MMNNSNSATKDIRQKALMAVMGLVFLVYLIFHSLSNLSFFAGESDFNALYIWLNSGIFWRFIVPVLLVIAMLYHVFIAITKQLKNNTVGSKYHKRYPQDIPRVLVWSAILLFLAFLILHIVQVQSMDIHNVYNEISTLFNNIVFVVIYIIGTIILLAHLHHGLKNVDQTLALKCKLPVTLLLIMVGVGFISIPLVFIV